MKKKSSFTRSILLRDQYMEDGRTIGRLNIKARWLAHKLAVSGIMPEYVPDAGRSADDIARITDEWLAVAENASRELYSDRQQPRQ